MKIFLKNQFVFYQKNSEAQIDNFASKNEQVLDIHQAIKKKSIYGLKSSKASLWIKAAQKIQYG